ncbi:MAG: hypothetical protein U5K79_19335 [Cyclobacteriaceae bacterium]|nr:hypothetical protein [Cyclobacteriaceae bacterium]
MADCLHLTASSQEFLLYSGLFKGLFTLTGIPLIILVVLSIVGLVLVGGISLITFTKLYGVIFLGQPRAVLNSKPVEASFIMLLPQYFIVAVMFSVAFFPQFYLGQVMNIIHASFASHLSADPVAFTDTGMTMTAIGRVGFIFLVAIIVVFIFRYLMVKKQPVRVYETWGCGYVAPVAKAQYTGRSYARTFGRLLGFVVNERQNFDPIKKSSLYPSQHKFSTYYFDWLEKFLVMPLTRRIAFILNYFQFIQNGKIQSYVIYGLFFIIIVFLGTVLNWVF